MRFQLPNSNWFLLRDPFFIKQGMKANKSKAKGIRNETKGGLNY